MASNKRMRQRQNAQTQEAIDRRAAQKTEKNVSLAKKAEWSARVDRLFDAEKNAYYGKNAVQTATGLVVAATFYYGLVAKMGAVIEKSGYDAGLHPNPSPIPTFRGILPEPFDYPSHMANAYWTKLLMDAKVPFTQLRMRDPRYGIAQIDHQLFGDPEPSIASRIVKAGVLGTALHVGVEAISAGMPGRLGELMGGFDPLDVAYGGAAAMIIAGYDMHKRRQAIIAADSMPGQV